MNNNNINNISKQYELIIKSTEQASRNMSKAFDILSSPILSLSMEKQVQLLKDMESMSINIPKYLSDITDVSQAFKKQIEEIEYISKLSQKTFESLKINNYIDTLKTVLPDFNILTNSLTQMSSSYSILWKNIEEKPDSFIEEIPIIMQQPPVDFYHASRLSFLITNHPFKADDQEKLLLENKHQIIYNFFYKGLSQIDPQLFNLYKGAIDVIKSDNLDKQRHFTVSLRELFTKVLHNLSAYDKFIDWNEDPSNLDKNGRPTRRGRLLYIYRNINYPPFHCFIEKDISAALAFIDLFQKGAHSIKGPFNNQQLWGMLYRMESIIYYLIKISLVNQKIDL